MRIAILGAAGMIGERLTHRLLERGHISGRPIGKLILLDRAAPAAVNGPAIEVETGALDISEEGAGAKVAALAPDVVFHLAAVVSAEAETNFAKGYDINVRALWNILEALRHDRIAPRFIFTSSLAVYGPPFPEVVPDNFHASPQSSYGAQKAIGELLLSDYSRKGFVDGVAIRLPTIVVRPGKPNAAASGFLSSIIREPVAGLPAALPVPAETRVWIASPDIAVETLVHAADLPSERLRNARTISGRGLCVSIQDMLDAMEALLGKDVLALIRRESNPEVARIVTSWPSAFETLAAENLGFPVDASMAAIVAQHIGGVRT